ncbi:hypothetical protein GCM10023063_17300 [Arthrobacter methylotrophus]|uniref:DUF4177 domain-containing protein n=1 Tax=Arthrobacter methylotrophus TaxID=121291 RepID=A0ABV5UNP4_9MICC
MTNYKVFWVPESISYSNEAIEAKNSTALINEWSEQGYELVSVAPGTNAQTYGGLFVTLKHE